MAFIRRLRNQNWLFPPSIADLIEEDHICRHVDEVVEGIDLKRIEKTQLWDRLLKPKKLVLLEKDKEVKSEWDPAYG